MIDKDSNDGEIEQEIIQQSRDSLDRMATSEPGGLNMRNNLKAAVGVEVQEDGVTIDKGLTFQENQTMERGELASMNNSFMRRSVKTPGGHNTVQTDVLPSNIGGRDDFGVSSICPVSPHEGPISVISNRNTQTQMHSTKQSNRSNIRIHSTNGTREMIGRALIQGATL